MDPIISFIIPVYNSEKYIKRSISSLLAIDECSYKIEIIVIDDGSTDDSEKICRSLAIEDGRLIYIKKDNGGVSSARNLGILRSTGKYIIFVDADDEFSIENFEKLYDALIKTSSDAIVFDYTIVDEQGSVLSEPKLNLNTTLDAEELCHRYVSYPVLGRLEDGKDYLGGKVFQYALPRDILLQNRILFNEKLHFAEDMCFLYTAMMHIKKCQYIAASYYNYYVNGDSVSHSFRMQFWDDWKKVLDYISGFVKSEDEFELIRLGVNSMMLHYYGNHLKLRDFTDVASQRLLLSSDDKAYLRNNCTASGLYQVAFKYTLIHDYYNLMYFVIRIGGKILRGIAKFKI